MAKYLKSDGSITSKIDDYIVDLFKLYFTVHPDDIPGTNIGFNFIMNGVQKVDIASEITARLSELIEKMQERFSGVSMSIKSVNIIDYERAKIEINVGKISDTIEVGLYEE
jgi:hypothetical protein